jgi:hypothetical protein
MTYHPDRWQQVAQQTSEYQSCAYEPQPLSLHDEETLPERYPAFYNEQTYSATNSPVGSVPSVDPVPNSESASANGPWMAAGPTPDAGSQFAAAGNQQRGSTGYPASLYPPAYRPRPFLPWLLIVAGAVGGILLLLGAGFVALNASGLPPLSSPALSSSSSQNVQNTNSSTMTPTDVVSNYYNAVEQQNYAQAYKYVDVNTSTSPWRDGQPASQDLFTRQGAHMDDDYGTVTNYSIYRIEMVDSNYARATLGIRREGDYYYHVAIDLRMINGVWRIVQFNRI